METAVNVADTSAANEAVGTTITPSDADAFFDNVENLDSKANVEKSLDDDLRSIWDKRNPLRGEGGKFAPKNPAETAAEGATEAKPVADQTAETTLEQAKPAIDAPVSWSAEQKAKWASLPPDTREYIAQRDKESHEAISRAGQQIKAFEPIGKVIEQFAHVFQKNGLQPHDGIARMLAVNEMLEQNPRSAIAEIAKAYGVNLQGNAEQDANPDNPRIAELEARLAKTESHLTAQQRQQLQAEQTALAREIADFAKDKPHFGAVRKVMAGLMQSGAVETMQDAYERAIYADPTIRQSLQVEAQKEAEAKRKAEESERLAKAKKAAGVNVKSSPGQSNPNRTLDDDLREIARKHYGT